MAVDFAKKKKLKNFSILSSHVLVPPAIEVIMSSNETKIQAFLAAGHVCTIMGYHQYVPLSEKYKIPIIITGFEPVDILLGILAAIQQLEKGKYFTENKYTRYVKQEGNIPAQNLLKKVYNTIDRKWRGIGSIGQSGFALKKEYADFDADKIFNIQNIKVEEPEVCISGAVMQGNKKPLECLAFGTECTPEKPLGAPMVSTEGACAAYFHYKKEIIIK